MSRIALLAFDLKLIIYPVNLRVDRNKISRMVKFSRASKLVVRVVACVSSVSSERKAIFRFLAEREIGRAQKKKKKGGGEEKERKRLWTDSAILKTFVRP